MQNKTGILYAVATPIGNLADLSARARQILAEVDFIAAEDTRTTQVLLNHYGIRARLIAYHDHNEIIRTPRLLKLLSTGHDLALVTEAGTPLISDPGYHLVAAACAKNLRVVPIPGANAAICALCASGLPSDRFLFLGFPPRTTSQRQTWLFNLIQEPGTLIFYESPNRIQATLTDIAMILGEDRHVVLARELTKHFETFLRGCPHELLKYLKQDPAQQLGEMVLLIAGYRENNRKLEQKEPVRILRILAENLPLSQAVTITARLTNQPKNTIYRLGLELGLATKK